MSELDCRLKELRETRGWSAAELAAKAGVSRQTIHAIEAGNYVPNTLVSLKLAGLLGVGVESIFRLPDEGAEWEVSAELLNPEADAGLGVQVSQVGSKTVAVAGTMQPAWLPAVDGTATSISGANVSVQLATGQRAIPEQLVIAGCDPALSFLARVVRRLGIETILISAPSTTALDWLREEKIHVAGSHLSLQSSAVTRLLKSGPHRAFTFAEWQEGFVVAKANPKSIRSAADLAGVSIVNRERGAASRILLDRVLAEASIPSSVVKGFERLAPGHLPAAAVVAAGQADCCVATQAAARAYGLDFIPIADERFDLFLPSALLARRPFAALVNGLQEAALRGQLTKIAGYETRHTGSERT